MRRWLAALIPLLLMGQMFPFPVPGRAPSGPSNPVTQIFTGGMNIAYAAGQTRFSPIQGMNNAAVTTASAVETVMVKGTLSNLTVALDAATASGDSDVVITVLKNGSATSLSCPVTQTTSSCTDSTHNVPVDDGDTIVVQNSMGATLAAGRKVFHTLKWVGGRDYESMLTANWLPGASAVGCGSFVGSQSGSTGTCGGAIVGSPAAGSFNITGILARSAAVMATNCNRLVLNLNNLDKTNYQVDIDAGHQNASVLSVSGSPAAEAVTAGVMIAVKQTPGTPCGTLGTASTERVAVTLRMENTSQYYMAASATGGTTATAANRFMESGGTLAMNATEANVRLHFPSAITLRAMAVKQSGNSGTAGSGKKYTYSLRDMTTPTTYFGCDVLDDVPSCSATGTQSFTAGRGLGYFIVPDSTNAPTTGLSAIVSYMASSP